jgi:hypothetical protein
LYVDGKLVLLRHVCIEDKQVKAAKICVFPGQLQEEAAMRHHNPWGQERRRDIGTEAALGPCILAEAEVHCIISIMCILMLHHTASFYVGPQEEMFWFDVRGTATLLKSATCMSGSHFNAWIPTKQCNTHLWASSAVPCMSVGHIVLGQDVVCV